MFIDYYELLKRYRFCIVITFDGPCAGWKKRAHALSTEILQTILFIHSFKMTDGGAIVWTYFYNVFPNSGDSTELLIFINCNDP